MAKILIVEDEVLVAEQLRKYIERIGHTCCGHATSYEEATELLMNEKPDLALLDIRLFGDRSGIEVAQLINEKNKIPFIFLSSHFEKSTLEKARNTRPAGYLTKPYNSETLSTTIEICLYNYSNRTASFSEKVEIIEGKKKHILSAEQIFFFAAEHVYTRLVTDNKEILIRKSLNDIMESLPSNIFLRVHRGFVVNMNHIKQVNTSQIIVGDHKIPIGTTFKEDVKVAISS